MSEMSVLITSMRPHLRTHNFCRIRLQFFDVTLPLKKRFVKLVSHLKSRRKYNQNEGFIPSPKTNFGNKDFYICQADRQSESSVVVKATMRERQLLSPISDICDIKKHALRKEDVKK